MGKAFIDRAGETYGKLYVLSYLGKIPGKSKNYWYCQCSCGAFTCVTTSNLSTGHTTSCGCERVFCGESKRQYPKEYAAEYGIWRGIRQRTGKCPGKKNSRYVGVSCCQEWLDSFDSFIASMGKRPTPDHSIERVDNSKGYTPDNCIWATPTTQANNRDTNKNVEHLGRVLTVAQWSKELEIKQATINARLRAGWSVENALYKPLRKACVSK